MNLPFVKMQAVGNDFVVLPPNRWPADTDWSALAVRLCERRFGIGGDGLLLVLPSEVAALRMRMFNPDGTEDMCGNGLRCVIRYAAECGLFSGSSGVAETLDGLHPFWLNENGAITVEMGRPQVALEKIPVARALYSERQTNQALSVEVSGGVVVVDTINTGSTHCVLWRDHLPDDAEFFQISPSVETAPAFPERTSVLWAVVEDPTAIQMRIWERGAGETLGCGTGACAAAVLGRRMGRLSPTGEVAVKTKGGSLTVAWSGDDSDPMYLTGTAHSVYSGFLSP